MKRRPFSNSNKGEKLRVTQKSRENYKSLVFKSEKMTSPFSMFHPRDSNVALSE
jgi:hypothetical protein